MMRSPFILAATLGLAIGLALGIVAPRDGAKASSTLTIHFFPAVDYGYAINTCGWHAACEGSPNYANGLDWVAASDAYGTSRAFFHGWAFSIHASSFPVGSMTISNLKPVGSTCPSTSVLIEDNQGTDKALLYFVHSSPIYPLGSQYSIYGRTAGHWNSRHVGNFATGCGAGSADAHIMSNFTWPPGAAYTIPRDLVGNCTGPSYPGGSFYFACFDPTYPAMTYSRPMPHNFDDWQYVAQYTIP